MPWWPFKKRRRNTSAPSPLLDAEEAPSVYRAATLPSSVDGTSSPIPIPRRSSKRGRPASLEEAEKAAESLDKENVPPRTSGEVITALPMSYKLEQSPHLRPVDSVERPHIPYNFRNYSGSQTSMPRDAVSPSPKPNVLRKKRSSYEATSTPQRKPSSRTRKDEQVREEEIRAMSSPSPVPKRPGEGRDQCIYPALCKPFANSAIAEITGPLRRDSKKIRSGWRESHVSLPAHEESLRESMPNIAERGWEVGALDIFNPRPAVRLSGTPQYIASASFRSDSPSTPEPPRKHKGRQLAPSESSRKRDTIGNTVDELDASDIRMLLERDAKRRDKRKKEQQEKLDRKLRNREGRNRGGSDAKRAEAEELRKAESRQRAEDELRALETVQQPSDIHPALRESPTDAVGVGIGDNAATGGAADTPLTEDREVNATEHETEDPFADSHAPFERSPRPSSEVMQGTITPAESNVEEPVLGTAREIRMSQASTPPLSPIQSTRAVHSLSQVVDAPTEPESELPAPVPISEPRRASQPVPERRVGALASLFRRSGTNSRKGSEPKATEFSFSNTSRESMRNQPLPPHLVDTQARTPVARRISGTPVRTQSKFREDLPELPISPPDSRLASPEASTPPTGRGQKSQPIDVPRQDSIAATEADSQPSARYDTPISPSLRHGPSLASVDSEGVWLASGSAKRQSKSGVAQRRADFSASYEELGGDTDAQYFSKTSPNSGTPLPESSQRPDSSATLGVVGEAEYFDTPEGEETSAGDREVQQSTPTVHRSVQRHPTLVQRDPRFRSREGLLDDFSAEPTSAADTRGSFEFDSDPEAPEPELQRASSVQVHRHQSSSGSARLFSYSPRRGSADMLGDSSQPPTPK